MMLAPKNGPAPLPLTERGADAETKLTRNSTPAGPSEPEILALVAMLRNRAARERAYRLGPGLFDDPAARRIAAVIAGDTMPSRRPEPESKAQRLGAAIVDLCARLERSRLRLADDDGWAVHLVADLAERQHHKLLARQLRWAAERAEARDAPLRWLRRRVGAAFDISEGVEPAEIMEDANA